MRTYRQKSPTVTAIQFTDRTAPEALRFLRRFFPTARVDSKSRLVCDSGGPVHLVISHGRWLVEESKDRVSVMSAEEFEETYEAVEYRFLVSPESFAKHLSDHAHYIQEALKK